MTKGLSKTSLVSRLLMLLSFPSTRAIDGVPDKAQQTVEWVQHPRRLDGLVATGLPPDR
jgi:hypothetical protein